MVVDLRSIGEACDTRAIGIHHIDLIAPEGDIAVAVEGDLGAVRGPRGPDVSRPVVRQIDGLRAVGVHQPNVEVPV